MIKPLSLKEAAARADEIQHSHRNGVQCTLSKVVSTFTDDDFEILKSLVKSEYQHATIARVLNEAGHDVSALMISRHRGTNSNPCKCGMFDE
jgi:hypothetical protein